MAATETADFASVAVGTIGTIFGLTCFISPHTAGRHFGVPLPVNVQPETVGLMRVLGGRNICMGASMLAFYIQGQRKAMSIILLSIVVGGSVDGWVTWRLGNRKEAIAHLVGGGVIAALGGYLWNAA